MDPKQAHVEQLSSGRWAIFNPDCSRFDGKTFASKSAARRELIFLRAGAIFSQELRDEWQETDVP